MKCHAQKDVVIMKKCIFNRSPVLVDYIVDLFGAQPDVFFFLVNCVVYLCVLGMLVYVFRGVKTV
jgi:hypothetical protein